SLRHRPHHLCRVRFTVCRFYGCCCGISSTGTVSRNSASLRVFTADIRALPGAVTSLHIREPPSPELPHRLVCRFSFYRPSDPSAFSGELPRIVGIDREYIHCRRAIPEG